MSEFDSMDEFIAHIDEVSRWNNGLPPRGPQKPGDGEVRARVPTPASPSAVGVWRKAHQVGVRLGNADFELLVELANAHAVTPSTMARMLIARGVRAAADDGEGR